MMKKLGKATSTQKNTKAEKSIATRIEAAKALRM
jgi:hypothetical protein